MGCNESAESSPDRDLFFAVCNNEHHKVETLKSNGASIDWIFNGTKKGDFKKGMSALGVAFNINYDIRELLSNQRIDYKNEGHIKGIFRVQSDKRGKILLDAYKLGFGFHHPRFLQTMEGGSDHHMNRFKEACLCPFASQLYENSSVAVAANDPDKKRVWVTVYRQLADEEDGEPKATVFIFRTGVASYDSKDCNCKIVNAKIVETSELDPSSGTGKFTTRWSITGSEIWKIPDHQSVVLQKYDNHKPLVFTEEPQVYEWFKAALTQVPIQFPVPYDAWTPIFRRLNVAVPQDRAQTLDTFMNDYNVLRA